MKLEKKNKEYICDLEHKAFEDVADEHRDKEEWNSSYEGEVVAIVEFKFAWNSQKELTDDIVFAMAEKTFHKATGSFEAYVPNEDSFVYEVSDAMVLQKSMIEVPEEIPIWEDE